MLARLLDRYPNGCLISELVQIHEGKFVVRAEVQIDGVTRATGMACAENLELAEDQARSRALMVLLPESNSSGQLELSAAHPSGRSDPQPGLKLSLPLVGTDNKQPSSFATTSARNSSTSSSFPSVPTAESSTLTPNGLPNLAVENYGAPVAVTPFAHAEMAGEPSDRMYDPQQEFEEEVVIPFGDLEPAASDDYSYESNIPETEPEPKPAAEVNEPFDLSDAIAQTSIQLKRLGWNNQQGRNYLEQTYGKRSRHELNDTEMLSFLTYLSSQPTPNQQPENLDTNR